MSQQVNLPSKTPSESATAAPTTVRYAFWLVFASAVLSLLAPAFRLVQVIMNNVPPDVLASYREISPQATAGAIKTTVVAGQIVTLGIYLVAAAILVFAAKKMKAGRSWAKWVTTVVLVIGVLMWSTWELISPIDRLVSVAIVICAVVAIVFMFIPASRPHFQHSS